MEREAFWAASALAWRMVRVRGLDDVVEVEVWVEDDEGWWGGVAVAVEVED